MLLAVQQPIVVAAYIQTDNRTTNEPWKFLHVVSFVKYCQTLMKLCTYMHHSVFYNCAKYHDFLSTTPGSKPSTVNLLFIHYCIYSMLNWPKRTEMFVFSL
jgi:hypothetical protein